MNYLAATSQEGTNVEEASSHTRRSRLRRRASRDRQRRGRCRAWSWIPSCEGRDADYRVFEEIRKANAIRFRVGLEHDAATFVGWVLDAIDRAGRTSVVYDLDGHPPPSERSDPNLEGYRRSRPVRWGNGAAEQKQNDAYGEMIDCAYQWHRRGGEIAPRVAHRLRDLVERAAEVWRRPDHGIWEVRTAARPFTYSAAMSFQWPGGV